MTSNKNWREQVVFNITVSTDETDNVQQFTLGRWMHFVT